MAYTYSDGFDPMPIQLATDYFYRDSLTDNLKVYYDEWKVLLHKTCSKTCDCRLRAERLTEQRKECIARGMPDMHPDVERRIMPKAFELHRKHHYLDHVNEGVLVPNWINPNDAYAEYKCDCFEEAATQLGICFIKIQDTQTYEVEEILDDSRYELREI